MSRWPQKSLEVFVRYVVPASLAVAVVFIWGREQTLLAQVSEGAVPANSAQKATADNDQPRQVAQVGRSNSARQLQTIVVAQADEDQGGGTPSTTPGSQGTGQGGNGTAPFEDSIPESALESHTVSIEETAPGGLFQFGPDAGMGISASAGDDQMFFNFGSGFTATGDGTVAAAAAAEAQDQQEQPVSP